MTGRSKGKRHDAAAAPTKMLAAVHIRDKTFNQATA